MKVNSPLEQAMLSVVIWDSKNVEQEVSSIKEFILGCLRW
jgi:hypothetical protein